MNAFTLSPLLVGGAVAAALAIAVLLYLLRPPARRRFVASNLIWQRVLETYRGVSDRWRWWLSSSYLTYGLNCAMSVKPRSQSTL